MKLIYFGIFVFLVPIIFVSDYTYITITTNFGFIHSEVRHGVQHHGIQLFFCLLVIATTMFFAGLVHPKISIWFGEKTTQRSSTIYGIVVGIAVVELIEVNLISSSIYKYEDRIMIAFYEDIEIGSSIDEVQNLSISPNKHLGHSDSLAEREKDLIAYDQNRNFVEFTYPNKFRTRRVIVETKLNPSQEDARIIGKFLLIKNRITRSKS
jgi:hypothetical protein